MHKQFLSRVRIHILDHKYFPRYIVNVTILRDRHYSILFRKLFTLPTLAHLKYQHENNYNLSLINLPFAIGLEEWA